MPLNVNHKLPEKTLITSPLNLVQRNGETSTHGERQFWLSTANNTSFQRNKCTLHFSLRAVQQEFTFSASKLPIECIGQLVQVVHSLQNNTKQMEPKPKPKTYLHIGLTLLVTL